MRARFSIAARAHWALALVPTADDLAALFELACPLIGGLGEVVLIKKRSDGESVIVQRRR